MKKMWLILSLVVFLGATTGCKDDDGAIVTPPEVNSLVGTKWKLVGFFDVEKNELTEIEPKSCEKCYALNFETDNTVSGQGVNIYMSDGCYIADYTYSTLQFEFSMPSIDEPGDGNIYWDILYRTSNFELKDTELKLYSNDKKSYLQYTMQENP